MITRLALPAERPLQYLGLASGLLLADAEILSGLSAAGATIGSITLVDAEYGKWRSQRDVAALAQLSGLFSPAPVTAFNTLPSFMEACGLHPERFKADVLVACDPSTHVAQLFRRFASETLAERGHANTIVSVQWIRYPSQRVNAKVAQQLDKQERGSRFNLQRALNHVHDKHILCH